MRAIVLTLSLAALAASAAEPSFQFWDGEESIEEYGAKHGLSPTKSVDLGNGVSMELVLIPAWSFTMGTPEPPLVNEDGFHRRLAVGAAAFVLGTCVLLALLGLLVVRVVRRQQRLQYSLTWLLAMVVAAGVSLLGGLHWWLSTKAFAKAQDEYQAGLARFRYSVDNEKPAHPVCLTTPYYIGKYEVTQEQYHEVMGGNPSHFKGRDLPVEQVSWCDAQRFCKITSDRLGRVIRLPTEAEWEHACRAGTKTIYYTGDTYSDLDRSGWYEKNSNRTTHPVGQKTPNAWGTYDMHGNVWEWCEDWYGEYKPEEMVDPKGPKQGTHRVARGGAWGFNPGKCGSALRTSMDPKRCYRIVGFRVLMPLHKELHQPR